MGKFKDLTGMRFGRLTVIERAENKGRNVCWNCRCDCGNEVVVKRDALISGDTQSCGCLHVERAHNLNLTHGMTGTKVHRAWKSMKTRCFNSNFKYYANYGGRGITIYPAWINFQAFYDYVSKLPHFNEGGYSFDRIDNNGNYEPCNLRWSSRQVQNSNTRQNHYVEYEGEKMILKEAARRSGIPYDTLRNRIRRGDTGENLFRQVKNGRH